jgi:hypothetical protein
MEAILFDRWDFINVLKTESICFISGLSPYRSVNTLPLGYTKAVF